MALIIFLVALAVVGVAAALCGADSRDSGYSLGPVARPHGRDGHR